MDRRDDRPHLARRIESVADANLLRALDEPLDEAIVERAFEDEPRSGRADLSRIGEDSEERVVDGRVEVGIGEDDVRRLAAELERDLFQVRRRVAHDAASGLSAAGERDFVDELARGERVTDHRAGSEHDVHDAGRKLELLEDRRQANHRQRREFCGLEDADVARRERRRELPHRHEQRIVPRNDLSADADRLAHGEGLRGRGHVEGLSVRLRREARVVAETVGGVDRVVLGLAQRLAVVERVDAHELVAMRVDCFGDFEEQRRSIGGRDRSPRSFVERAPRRNDCRLGVVRGSLGHRRHRPPLAGLSSSRVPPSPASAPAAVDVHRNHAVDTRKISKDLCRLGARFYGLHIATLLSRAAFDPVVQDTVAASAVALCWLARCD